MTEQCTTCNPVTQEQCEKYRKEFHTDLDGYENRLQEKDVRDARNEGVMEVQTKVLWGIFTVSILSFVANLFEPLFLSK